MSGVDTDTTTIERIEIKEPGMFNVIFLNDDKTTMDFVVHVLVSIFNKSTEEAIALMLNVHDKGSAVVGTYIEDIALTKSEETNKMARTYGYPLKNKVQPA